LEDADPHSQGFLSWFLDGGESSPAQPFVVSEQPLSSVGAPRAVPVTNLAAEIQLRRGP